MPPGASMLIEVKCGSLDLSGVLESLARVDGVHAVFTVEDLEGRPWVLVMWRSLEEARSWAGGGGLDRLLGGCGYSYRLFRVTGHEHGPAHHGHHHGHH